MKEDGICCARKDSDRHLVAFVKPPGTGFHHANFMVDDPDEVGRDGRALLAYALWTPTNCEREDSLATWSPDVPHDFVHNHEMDAEPFGAPVGESVGA